MPAAVQISVKGKAHTTGAKDDSKRIRGAYEEKKPPPPIVAQSISNVAFLEFVIISRTLRIPPTYSPAENPVGPEKEDARTL